MIKLLTHRNTILRSLRSPGTPASASGALSALRKWADLRERARGLHVEWPIATERYSALDSIISVALGSDDLVNFRCSTRTPK